jgi:plasmid stabilization system protein ParE
VTLPTARTLAFTPEAEDDLVQARAWYSQISPALADRFSRAVDDGCRLIVQQPLAWPLRAGELRKLVLKRFPYSLLFRVRGDTVTVAAVAHHKRRPGFWRDRT